jgi:uncharacterized protein YjbI with pentapeptide repeats
MDPTVIAAAIGVTGTVIVGVTGYWASVRNTGKTIELTRTTVDLTRRIVELTEQGQVTDRYTKAIEQLGSDKLDVRVGGIYALERVARDSTRDHPTVTEVLSAFVREHSREQWPLPTDDEPDIGVPERMTRPDVQAAVTVIGRRDPEPDSQRVNLNGVRLAGADLTGARLTHALLIRADFAIADLTGAELARADIALADMTGVDLARANVTSADLSRAILRSAHLTSTCLADANLTHADLTEAALAGADLTGANLTLADLSRAYLADANLTGAHLAHASLTGAETHARRPHPRGLHQRGPRRRILASGCGSS